MATTTPEHATLDAVSDLIRLSTSSRWYLSAYLNTSRHEVVNKELRARLAGLLDEITEGAEETPYRDEFRDIKTRMMEYVESVRPGTDALALIMGPGENDDHALWLPGPVRDEVRFGPGAYVLPLLDLLDEWEPIAVAFVEKDQSYLIVGAAGQIEHIYEYHAQVPGRHKQGMEAERRWERHTVVHIERHLRAVVEELEKLISDRRIKRLFLSGPVEARKRFQADLPQALTDLVAGEVPIDSREPPAEAMERVWPVARDAERQEEEELVEELVNRAEKDALAVTGPDDVLRAVNQHQARELVMASDMHVDGRYCTGSDTLFGPMGGPEEQCDGPVRAVWLRQELPSYTLRRGLSLQVVHGDAARRLHQYGSLGALLRSPER